MYYPTHSTSGIISVMGAHMTEVSAQGYIYPDDEWFRLDTIWGNPFSNEVALYRMSNGATVRIAEFRRVGHVGRGAFASMAPKPALKTTFQVYCLHSRPCQT